MVWELNSKNGFLLFFGLLIDINLSREKRKKTRKDFGELFR